MSIKTYITVGTLDKEAQDIVIIRRCITRCNKLIVILVKHAMRITYILCPITIHIFGFKSIVLGTYIC